MQSLKYELVGKERRHRALGSPKKAENKDANALGKEGRRRGETRWKCQEMHVY